MNIAMTLKRMPTVAMQISDIVPVAGEIIMDATSNKLKIGDGVTAIKDLPYVESNPPEAQLSIGARAFIEDHIELLENNDYETFYSLIKTTELAREVSKALFKAGLNPKEHLKECPKGCESIFYYKGDDPNEDLQKTLTQKSAADPSIIKGIKGRPQYQRITIAPNSTKYWNEFIIGYDVNKRREDLEKRAYFQTWTLEDDE